MIEFCYKWAAIGANEYLATLLYGIMQVSKISPVGGVQLLCYIWNHITDYSSPNNINGIIFIVSLLFKMIDKRYLLTLKFLNLNDWRKS